MVRLSGLEAMELLLSCMASVTCVVVKMSVLWSSGCCLRICLSVRLVCGVVWYGTGLVNWLQKCLAIVWDLVYVWLLKVMGWLGSWCGRFPERLLKIFQYLREFWLVEQEAMVSLHASCRLVLMAVSMLWLSLGSLGLLGLSCLTASLSWMSERVSGVRPG